MHDPMGIPHETRPVTRIERLFDRVSRGLAILGGVIFIALITLSLVTIVGRKLGVLFVNGDIELMQAGTAIAVSCFLPYCTVLGEHLKVEFFTENAAPRTRLILDLIGDGLLAAIFAVLAWRTGSQALDMTEYGEVTPLLSIPMWWLVASITPCLAFTALCAAQRAITDLVHVLAPGAFTRKMEGTPS